MIRTSSAPKRRANVATITAPLNPWRHAAPRHRANVSPRPITVADERAAHRAASRAFRSDVA